MQDEIHLGVIGLSPGNGHPYSWSAIFNGYEKGPMENCGFPVIPRYLERRTFPDDCIEDAKVTHIWTQDKETSQKIATASKIEHIVEDYRDLLDKVDGVLLARDDCRRHLEFAEPFLRSGMPIYIDKPFAISTKDAEKLLSMQQYEGQIFSCSAMRYAPEFRDRTNLESIGQILNLHAVIGKDWDRYAVHLFDAITALTGTVPEAERCRVFKRNSRTYALYELLNGTDMQVATLGDAAAPIEIRVYGQNGWTCIQLQDTFRAFKESLIQFVESIRTRSVKTDADYLLRIVRLIELGRSE